ncbi:MAG: hypothetical protein ABIP94_04495 [Planctomycetota bacterium]
MKDGSSSSQRERLVEAVLAGDLAPDAPEVRALRARDARFATELDQLLELQTTLSARATEIREDLATPAPTLEDAAELAARRLLSKGRRRPNLTLWWAVAAALMMAVLLWWRPWNAPTAPPFLGGLPVAISEDQRELRIAWVLAPGQHFEVVILDGNGQPVRAPERFRVARWRPDPALVPTWSPSWQVELRVVSSDGGALPQARVEHWSPRL